MNDTLRMKCKELKIFSDIPYIEMAGYLEVKKSSFYSWLKGNYNFSPERLARLQEIITDLQGV